MARKKGMIFLVIILIILTISILPIVFSQDFNYSEAFQQQETSVEISNKIYSTSSKLDANLSLFPLDDERQTSYSTTIPEALPSNSGILFHFNKKGDLEFKLFANVSTKLLIKNLEFQNIKDIKNIGLNSPELLKYTKPSNYSDSSSAIIKSKAQQLAQGKNNSVEILYILAEYVKNSMTYDLDFSDLEKASKILEEKRGVCAHYTILFIALTRALGFPSRYVSGIAYSTEHKDFEEHAWAEVYLNDEWVPFDVTFGQYGWLDTSHIALKKSLDAGDSSVRYSYLGGYIQPDQLSINAKMVSYKENINFSNITLDLEPYQNQVAQESYLPVKVKIKNNNNYYITLPIRISIAPEVHGQFRKILLLEPLEEKETYFLIYFPYKRECKRGCITKIQIVDSFNDESEINITFSDSFNEISLEEANLIMNSTNQINLQDFDFYCMPEKEIYFKEEQKRVICNVKSAKSENLEICYNESCFDRYFEKDKLTQELINVGNETSSCFKLSNSGFSLNSCVTFNIKEKSFFEKILDWLKNFFNL
jgi:transglutaminase-like putative cysteine protease